MPLFQPVLAGTPVVTPIPSVVTGTGDIASTDSVIVPTTKTKTNQLQSKIRKKKNPLRRTSNNKKGLRMQISLNN